MNVAERFDKINIDVSFKPTQMIALLSLPDAEETERFGNSELIPTLKSTQMIALLSKKKAASENTAENFLILRKAAIRLWVQVRL